MRPKAIVISPGPCTPKEAGISLEAVKTFGSKLPFLGVCLGHQVIGEAYGAMVLRSEYPTHGKSIRPALPRGMEQPTDRRDLERRPNYGLGKHGYPVASAL